VHGRAAVKRSFDIALLFVIAACSSGSTDDASVAGGPSTGPPGAQGSDAPQEGGVGTPGSIPLPPSGVAMGATVVDGGTMFRVWAPNASSASVSGDFGNGAAVPLKAEGNGRFVATVAGARAGQHYRFTFTTDGQTFTRTDPCARALEGGSGDAIIVDPRTYAWKTKPFLAPRANEAVIYEMHVPSFNVAPGTSAGTFRSAVDKLDHLQALGVNMIELMPAQQFRGTVGWGYNPTSYYAPQASFGAPDDLRRFVDEAHARGIGVMLDVVLNHVDRQHQGMWCFDGKCQGDNGIYFFSDPKYAMTPWGPRPDYSKKEVADFLVDGLFLWLSEYRLDGFRWDSTSNIRALDGQGTVPGGRELMARANDVLHGLFPRALFVAEDYKGYGQMSQPTSSGGLGFDAQWDGLNGAVDGVVAAATDAERDVNGIRNVISFRYNVSGSQRVIFTENHDLAGNGGARLPTKIDSANPTSLRARKGSMLAAAIAVTAPGIPMLLQGQELLQSATWTNNLTPAVQWADAASQAPVLAFYRDLLRLRRNLDGVSAGLLGDNVNVFHVNSNAKVLAYQRWKSPGDDVVIVANFSGTAFASYAVGLPAAGSWRVRLNGDSKKYSADFGDTPIADVAATAAARDGLPVSGAVSLPPYSVVILSR
jgi:1,4-alpha-glucan branching enzyme